MAKFIPRLLTFLLLAKLTIQQKLEPITCDCGFTDENNNYWSNVWHSDFSTYQDSIHVDSNFVISTYTIPAKHENTLSRVFSKDNADILDGRLRLAVSNDNGNIKCGSISTSRYGLQTFVLALQAMFSFILIGDPHTFLFHCGKQRRISLRFFQSNYEDYGYSRNCIRFLLVQEWHQRNRHGDSQHNPWSVAGVPLGQTTNI